MRLIASKQVNAGSTRKQLQLYVGDLSDIPAEESVDVLVVSAFANNYVPTSKSLIGALARRGISVLELSRNKEADLRAVFSSWLSRDISKLSPQAGFRRILCFESGFSDAAGPKGPPSETVGDVFRAIMPFVLGDPPIRSIAMPILAAGDQGHDLDVMFGAICDAATHWLAAGLPIDTVKVVARTVETAERLAPMLAPPSAEVAAPSTDAPPSAGPHDFFNMARIRHRDSARGVLKPIYLKSAQLPLYMRSVQYIDCREADRELISKAVGRLVQSMAP